MASQRHANEGESHLDRPRLSRETSNNLPYVPQPESLILPDGPINEEVVELLEEFVHPHSRHDTEETLVSEEDEESNKSSNAPWWKRPSPWWLLGILPFTAIAMAATTAPRIEIYTILACSVHKPDIFRQAYPEQAPDWSGGRPIDPAFAPYAPIISDTTPTIYLPENQASYNETDDSPSKRRNLCATDPTVQAAVARLTAVISSTMGIMSLITTGWWGAFSDRHGRTRVMGISILALLVTDFNFIMVAKLYQHIPGGYWFLVVGPALEGLLGGMATGIAAMHGYMADTTTESSRSRMFSLSLGLLFSGMAIGPTVGSLLIRVTGETLSVFYLATGVHLVYTFLAWLVIPESLSKKKRDQAKVKYAAELLDAANEREQNPAVGMLVKTRRLFAFLLPLTVFAPTEEKLTGNPLKKPKKDYNLAFMAIAYGFTVSLLGSFTYKFQYAAATYGWSTETIGYWVSLSGASRALYMALILPTLIRFFKPKPIVLNIPPSPSEDTPLLPSAERQTSSASSTKTTPKGTRKEIHSPAFDLGLARASLIVEIIAYTCMGFAPSAVTFLIFSQFASLGSGFGPATQSVIFSLYSRRGGTETGRLFGALSVIQALCSQIIGPALYGFVYIKTVAVFPQTLFFVTTLSVTISFVLLSMVRLPKDSDYQRESLSDLEEEPVSRPQT